MDEIAAVVNRQRREGEQQRGNEARDESEYFHGAAKQQNHRAADDNGRESQLGFRQFRKVFCTAELRDGFGDEIQDRAVTVLRVVFESFTRERVAGDKGVHGFIRVHRAFAESRQADG